MVLFNIIWHYRIHTVHGYKKLISMNPYKPQSAILCDTANQCYWYVRHLQIFLTENQSSMWPALAKNTTRYMQWNIRTHNQNIAFMVTHISWILRRVLMFSLYKHIYSDYHWVQMKYIFRFNCIYAPQGWIYFLPSCSSYSWVCVTSSSRWRHSKWSTRSHGEISHLMCKTSLSNTGDKNAPVFYYNSRISRRVFPLTLSSYQICRKNVTNIRSHFLLINVWVFLILSFICYLLPTMEIGNASTVWCSSIVFSHVVKHYWPLHVRVFHMCIVGRPSLFVSL